MSNHTKYMWQRGLTGGTNIGKFKISFRELKNRVVIRKTINMKVIGLNTFCFIPCKVTKMLVAVVHDGV